MATTAVTVPSGGLVDSLWYWLRDADGYIDSVTGTAPANGSADGVAIARLLGIKNFPFAAQDPQRPSQPGDGGVIARFLVKPTELPEASFATAADDYAFRAAAESTKVLTLGGGRGIAGQPYNPSYANMGFLLVSGAQSVAVGNEGSMFEGRIIFNCNVSTKGRNTFDTANVPDYNYNLVANNASAFPWGHAFTDADEGDTQFVYWDFTWPYKPFIEHWNGDATTVSWNLTQNIAEDSADNIVVFDEGVALTWVTGAPSGATEFGITAGTPDLLVTFTANPGVGDRLVALYGWS